MKLIHYPNKIRSHLVAIVPIALFTPKSTSKLRSALFFRYSIVITRFIPALMDIGYEPAGLTVHPPPQNDRGWVNFFHMGV